MKWNIYIIYLIFILVTSCAKKQNKNDFTLKTDSTEHRSNVEFEKFRSNFKPIEFKELSSLINIFSSMMNQVGENTGVLEVNDSFKLKFLPNVKSEHIYYGFQSTLPNNTYILIFFNNCGSGHNAETEEVIDTTFFTSSIYDKSGKTLSSFRLFGTNETGTPPTYSLISSFEYQKNKLIVNQNEYSTGKSYADVKLVEGTDSLDYADLKITKFYFDYHTNKIVQLGKSYSKTKVTEPYRTAFLKPID